MGPEALTPLSLLVADSDRGIRSDAIKAVAAIYVEPPPKHRVDSPEEAFGWTPYRVTPWAVPPALVANLVRALADDWPSVRRDAVYGLGVVLTPPDRPGARRRTDLLAGRSGTPRCGLRRQGSLASCCHHPGRRPAHRPHRRSGAGRAAGIHAALGEIREARALVALRDQLEFYRGGSAARAALDALARIAHPSTAGLFAAERLSENDVHRRYAYEAHRQARRGSGQRRGGFREAVDRRAQSGGHRRDCLRAGCRRPGPTSIGSSRRSPIATQRTRRSITSWNSVTHTRKCSLPHLQHADPAVRERVAMAVGFHGWRWRRGCAHAVDPRPGPGGASGSAGGDHAVASPQPASGARLRSSCGRRPVVRIGAGPRRVPYGAILKGTASSIVTDQSRSGASMTPYSVRGLVST